VCIYILREASHRKDNQDALKTAEALFRRYTWSLPDHPTAGPADRRVLQKQIVGLKVCVAQLGPDDGRKAVGLKKLSTMRSKLKKLKEVFGRYGQPTSTRAAKAVRKAKARHRSSLKRQKDRRKKTAERRAT